MNPTYLQNISLAVVMVAVWAPFAAFGVIFLLTRGSRRFSALLAIGAVGLSLVSAVALLLWHRHMAVPLEWRAHWFVSGRIALSFGFLLDPLSLLMLAVVAAIGFLVQIYSLGYMKGDPGFSRYYGLQSLFAGAMLSLSVSASLLQLYVFWELVGLSSYFLIGFWYERFSATQAGKKAFVMTRLGDVAFFLGMLTLLLHLGDLNILDLNAPGTAGRLTPALMTLCAVLIFGGIVGKSAQFPLLTWLPDAMEGPTPVSALLHSATMVAAGVFLFARLFPFFSASPGAMRLFLAVGTVTMIMSSTMAMVSDDIKQVWAYSTISQLGYMIMGLGAGALFAGTFHLLTHAGFKALLFLCAGVWIHYYETNDVFAIAARGGRRLKIPMLCLVLGAASLAGLPPMAGYFSKEAILASLARLESPIWLAAGLLGVFMTAYYAFRVIFIILRPGAAGERSTPLTATGPRDTAGGSAYWFMAVPLMILAAVITFLGFFRLPLQGFLDGGVAAALVEGVGWVPLASIALGLSGLLLTWVEFGRKRARQVGFIERVAWLRTFFLKRWYLDDVYRFVVKRIVDRALAALADLNDRVVIDGGLDGLSRWIVFGGRVVARFQSGLLRANLMFMLALLLLLMLLL